MPKRIVYTYEQLRDMSDAEVKKIVRREAERLNRQISRYKEAGAYAPDVFGSKQLERIKIKSQIEKRNKRQNIYLYEEMQKRSVGGLGVTHAGAEASRRARKEYAEELNISEDVITAEDLPLLHAAAEQAATENAAFYEVLLRAVEQRVVKDTQFFRTTSDTMTELSKTVEGRRQIMEETIAKINKAVTDWNKQARAEGVKSRDKLHRRFSLEQASKQAKSKARKARKEKYKSVKRRR